MDNQNSKSPWANMLAAGAVILASVAVIISAGNGIFFYIYTQRTSQERLQIDFQSNTIDQIKARRIVIVDNEGNERITLGIGRSEFTDAPNASIKLISPRAKNPIILSTTDENASVSVSKRAFLSASEENQRSNIALYQDEYKKGAIPQMVLITDDKTDDSRFVITDGNQKPVFASASTKGNTFSGAFDTSGRPRTISGINSEGVIFDELFNNNGELIYAVHSTSDNPYAKTYVKQDPATQIWNGMSTFSTLKTFWDIFFK